MSEKPSLGIYASQHFHFLIDTRERTVISSTFPLSGTLDVAMLGEQTAALRIQGETKKWVDDKQRNQKCDLKQIVSRLDDGMLFGREHLQDDDILGMYVNLCASWYQENISFTVHENAGSCLGSFSVKTKGKEQMFVHPDPNMEYPFRTTALEERLRHYLPYLAEDVSSCAVPMKTSSEEFDLHVNAQDTAMQFFYDGRLLLSRKGAQKVFFPENCGAKERDCLFLFSVYDRMEDVTHDPLFLFASDKQVPYGKKDHMEYASQGKVYSVEVSGVQLVGPGPQPQAVKEECLCDFSEPWDELFVVK